jgi:hypothetical protein
MLFRGFAAVHCCAYTQDYPFPKAPRDHLPLVFGRRGLLHKNAGTQAPEEGSPTNVRCKAPHLIKIILAYSPKKKRANPIEDESEVQKGHFCPPPFSRSPTWTLPLIQLPASKQLAFLFRALNPLQGMEVWMNRHKIEVRTPLDLQERVVRDRLVPHKERRSGTIRPLLAVAKLGW